MGVVGRSIESVNKVFSDRRLIWKAGFLFGINLILNLISFAVRASSSVVTFIPDSYGQGYKDFFSIFLSWILPMLISFLTLPVWLYQKGYAYSISNNIRKGLDESVVPEHQNIREKIKLGGVYLTIEYTLVMPFAIASLVPVIVFSVYPSILDSLNISTSLIIVAATIFVAIAFAIIFLLIDSIVVPIMMYLYLKTGSLVQAFSFKSFIKILGSEWSAWIYMVILSITIAVITMVVRVVLCFLSVAAGPFIQTISYLITSAVLGGIYYNIDARYRKK
ncbi:DUF4013 domain-containing protein [Candidatus Dojkabacteria bacterium]|nr:DUF4013 domain-containing protein [Candidatus Dojkabacteria bacterium]